MEETEKGGWGKEQNANGWGGTKKTNDQA